MIGIYQDNFVEFLREYLGDPIKVKAKNIVAKCPFCIEHHKDKEHLHLYISLEAPIFNCFQAGCSGHGSIKKLIKKLQGSDISDKFIDQKKLKESTIQRKIFKEEEHFQVLYPSLKTGLFANKVFYLRKRLKFANIELESIKGLVFDVNEFIEMNKIQVDEKLFRMRDFLHNNFIGFVTENNSSMVLRNIDELSDFRYYKMKIQDSKFLDYYKLNGNAKNSKQVILSEGIFDIASEHIFDSLNLKDSTRLYASAHSSKYDSLIKSIVFNEQEFRLNVVILSDLGIDMNYYRNLRRYNSHIINSLVVFINKTGKDFNITPVTPEKFVI